MQFFIDSDAVSEPTLPYQSELGVNPSITEITQHVIKEKRRPAFPAALQVADKVSLNVNDLFNFQGWPIENEKGRGDFNPQ